ncbi:MAG: ATP-binding cassette domain-containing protein, partial [Emergencia timonensis]
SNISFQYSPDGPKIIDNLSLKIRPNQYVAIVGKTGCGKSTLMRILLGFEKPQTGSVYFDGKDLDSLDVKSVRRNIGVVMQNSSLFAGDIYSNIVVSAPWLGLEDAWEAARMAGIAEDIQRMPMNMHTVISEGSGGISGGQKQRLMIARAIAPKPKIIMFDEATSALDNITQKQVSESLSGLRSTRIVIAHRLSTIKQCDRIIYLEDGKIAEDGTFDQLVALNGKFAELVRRQMI